MLLDYGSLISREPIKLSIGTIRKPTLSEVAEITFDKFLYYESFLKMTPEIVYTQLYEKQGKEYWDSLSEEERSAISIYKLILSDSNLQQVYTDLFNFFFVEKVVFLEGYFVILNTDVNLKPDEINISDIHGIISSNSFVQVLEVIQQTCFIYDKPKKSIDELKFKNDIARKMYEKMLKAQEEQDKRREKTYNKDHYLPNIISAVSNRHPCLNPINIWELTVYQLIDSFNRLQVNAVYDINQTRVSVWGDEKKTFDSSLWYKNNNDS